jgi:hypothetical protein
MRVTLILMNDRIRLYRAVARYALRLAWINARWPSFSIYLGKLWFSVYTTTGRMEMVFTTPKGRRTEARR